MQSTRPFAVTLHGADPGLRRVGDHIPGQSVSIADHNEAVRLVDVKGFSFDDAADEKRARQLAKREAAFRAIDLAELQGGKVADITEALPRLSLEQLTELRGLEVNTDNPRSTLVAKLDEAIEAHGAGDEAADTDTATAGGTP